MKPKIGQTAWMLITDAGEWHIDRETVGYLGRNGFIIEGYEYKRIAWKGYNCFGHSWFSTAKDAKAYAQSRSDIPLQWRHSFAGHYCADMAHRPQKGADGRWLL